MVLHRIADNGSFGLLLDHILRDRLFCGLWDEKIELSMLARQDLTLNLSFHMEAAAEAATNDATDMVTSKRKLLKITAK